jgi:uncharacterized membrane protein (UPF0127 family)
MLSKKKTILMIIIAIIVVLFAILGVWHFVLSRPNPPLRTTTVTIGNAIFSVEVASTTIEETRGLSGRAGLGQNEGMLFLFGSPNVQNFWMKDMNFPIDMIWIGGGSPSQISQGKIWEGKVLGFAENALPQPGTPLWNLKIYSSPEGVDTVLEVNAGTVVNDGIKVGDEVVISGVK